MELSLLCVFIKMSACIVRQELDNIAEGTWGVMAIGKSLFISCVIFHSQCSAKCKFVTELQCVTCEISMMVRLVRLKFFTTIYLFKSYTLRIISCVGNCFIRKYNFRNVSKTF